MSEDSLEPLITRCPNCHTRFRVTESQLQIASGRVRCGACLVVFEGTAHLSLDGEDMVPAPELDVDALLQELDEITDVEAAEPPPLPTIVEDDIVPLSPTELVDDTAAGEDLPDELLALEAALLEELRAEQATFDQPMSRNEDTQSGEDPGEEGPPLETTQAVAAELTDEPAFEPEGMEDDEQWLDDFVAGIWQRPAVSEDEQSTPEELVASISATPAIDEPHDSQEQTIELEALLETPITTPELTFEQAEDVKPRRLWLTLTFMLLALIGLPVQVLWFQYESWVKDANYRPVYQTICNVARCELPPMRDVSKIVSKKSFIRTHPERAEARIVDVLMVNNAEFAQPYPLIELVATSLRGQLVAGRRFKPAEYLQGDARASGLMPPHTPVHVSLEIQDPAEKALNFEVHFR